MTDPKQDDLPVNERAMGGMQGEVEDAAESADTSTVTTKDLRQFGLLMGGMIALMVGVVIPLIWGIRSAQYFAWVFGIAGTFAGLALIAPIVLKPIYIVWMKFAAVMGWINARLILSILFFLIVAPIGFIMRLFRSDPMARKLDESMVSYRVESNNRDADHLTKPF